MTAAKAGDKAKQDDATKRWIANADQIADFLSTANPKNWPQAEMRKMMRDHLNLTTEEVVARLQKNWAADIAAFDKVHGADFAHGGHAYRRHRQTARREVQIKDGRENTFLGGVE